jgi:hypothetical protein
MADLLPPDHIGPRRFQILEVKPNIRFMAAQLDVDGEVRTGTFLCGIIDSFVDAPNDIAQQGFLFPEDSFSEHTTSLRRMLSAQSDTLRGKNLRQNRPKINVRKVA